MNPLDIDDILRYIFHMIEFPQTFFNCLLVDKRWYKLAKQVLEKRKNDFLLYRTIKNGHKITKTQRVKGSLINHGIFEVEDDSIRLYIKGQYYCNKPDKLWLINERRKSIEKMYDKGKLLYEIERNGTIITKIERYKSIENRKEKFHGVQYHYKNFLPIFSRYDNGRKDGLQLHCKNGYLPKEDFILSCECTVHDYEYLLNESVLYFKEDWINGKRITRTYPSWKILFYKENCEMYESWDHDSFIKNIKYCDKNGIYFFIEILNHEENTLLCRILNREIVEKYINSHLSEYTIKKYRKILNSNEFMLKRDRYSGTFRADILLEKRL